MAYHGIGGAGYVLPGAQVYSAVVAAAAGGPFAPTDIPGCALWLDASDVSSLFQDTAGSTAVTADGQTIGRWSDKSGNSNHATQATSGSQPTYKTGIQNGLSVARFDGGDEIVTTLSPTAEFTVFVAAQSNDTSTGAYNDAFVGWRYVAPPLDQHFNLCKNGIGRYNSADVSILYNAGNGWNYWTAIESASGAELRAGGVSRGTAAAAAWNANNIVSISSVYPTNLAQTRLVGDIGEIIIYNSALGTIDSEAVESYLATKWGL